MVDGGYEISIHRGAIEQIFGTFYFLFCNPSLLPWLGKVSCEVALVHPATRLPATPIAVQLCDASYEPYCPNDTDRGSTAFRLAEMAVHFLIAHEIGHIVGGRFGLISGQRSFVEMAKRSGASASTFDELRQVCECDADLFATHAGNYVNTHPGMAALTANSLNCDPWSGLQAAQILQMTSVAALFRMLFREASTQTVAALGKHPHPAVRAALTVLPQSEVEFSLTCVSITSAGGFSDEHRFPGLAAS